MITQKAAGVELGTDKGSIVATQGMAVSIIVNVVILAAGSFAGAQVLQQPEFVVKALQLLLPPLFCALFVRFAMSKPFVRSVPAKGVIPGFASTRIAVFVSIAIAFFSTKNIIK